MRYTIPTRALKRALTLISKACTNRASLPILAGVVIGGTRLAEDRPGIRLEASDLEIWSRVGLPAHGEGDGALVVMAGQLKSALSGFDRAPAIELVIGDDDHLELSAPGQAVRRRLVGTSHDDYPTFPAFQRAEAPLLFPFRELDRVRERVLYATSKDDTRYNLKGVWIERLPEASGTRFVATDGHRLAVCESESLWPQGGGASIPGHKLSGCVIPRTWWELVGSAKRELASASAGELELRIEGANLELAATDAMGAEWGLLCRLIECEYADYRNVVPQANGGRVALNREAWREAELSLGSLQSRSHAVRHTFDGKGVDLFAMGEAGESEARLDFAQPSADARYQGTVMGFNGHYLAEAIGALPGDVTLQIPADGAVESPARIDAPEEPGTYALVMPMKL